MGAGPLLFRSRLPKLGETSEERGGSVLASNLHLQLQGKCLAAGWLGIGQARRTVGVWLCRSRGALKEFPAHRTSQPVLLQGPFTSTRT